MDGQTTEVVQTKSESDECEISRPEVLFNSINIRDV